jgi:hypothetical protein
VHAFPRFGPTAKIFTTLITLFNMGIFLLAELTTIGSLFSDFVGDRGYPIIIVVGVITSVRVLLSDGKMKPSCPPVLHA